MKYCECMQKTNYKVTIKSTFILCPYRKEAQSNHNSLSHLLFHNYVDKF